jgi:carbon storage regulator
MLVLTRKTGQRIQLGANISLTVVRVRGGQVRVAIEAPKEIAIYRGEIAGLGWRHHATVPDTAPSKSAAR